VGKGDGPNFPKGDKDLFYNNEKFKKVKKITNSFLEIVGLVVICIVLIELTAISINYFKNKNSEFGIVKAETNDTENTETEPINPKSTTQMLKNTTKCVVGISKLKQNGESIFQTEGATQIGIGSGVIVSENGYILTNQHVAGSKGSTCYITLEDGKQYGGSVVWSDESLDLCIVKVKMKFIDSCILGNSDGVEVGENVYAIGNPVGFEFQKTVTSGIISALDRTVVFKEGDADIYLSNLIQTDAIINPGNSGGPLINENGEVIGINTVKLTSADGIGFAIPINVVKPIVERFEKDGYFEEASIGIFAYDKNVIPYLSTGIKFDSGIYIAQISLDSPAFNSGLEVGDVITKIDGIELKKMCDLREYIYSKNIGDEVSLELLRNNKERRVQIRLNKK
jgi:S1-C subfamily serine protease